MGHGTLCVWTAWLSAFRICGCALKGLTSWIRRYCGGAGQAVSCPVTPSSCSVLLLSHTSSHCSICAVTLGWKTELSQNQCWCFPVLHFLFHFMFDHLFLLYKYIYIRCIWCSVSECTHVLQKQALVTTFGLTKVASS